MEFNHLCDFVGDLMGSNSDSDLEVAEMAVSQCKSRLLRLDVELIGIDRLKLVELNRQFENLVEALIQRKKVASKKEG